jgi:sigma-E factor negative regulatory protein RseA
MNESNAVKKVEMEAGEWLSALLDGELDGEQGRRAIAELTRDAAARERWAEYGLIGDALRDQAYDTAATLSRFRAVLADEPTVLAPLPAKRSMAPPSLWLAAAATVAGITWVVLTSAPDVGAPVPIAAVPVNGMPQASADILPYLTAHQDYAHAVLSTPEMNITQVSLSEVAR